MNFPSAVHTYRQSSIAAFRASSRADWMGLCCAIGCAVHCAAMPVLLAVLPSVAWIGWLGDPWVHRIVIVVSGCLLLRAMLPQLSRPNGSWTPLFGGFGLALLVLATMLESGNCCSTDNRTVRFDENESQISAQTISFRLHSPPLGDESSVVSTAVVSGFNPILASEEWLIRGWLALHSCLTDLQQWLPPLGGLLIAVAHVLNLRHCCGARSAD